MTPFEQALSAVEREDWPAADILLRPIIAADPNLVDAVYLFGLSLWHQNRHAEAEPQLLRAHELSPNYAPACFYLAGIYVARGDNHNAHTWLEKFVALSPADPNGWLRLGELMLAQTRYEAAAEKLRRALDLAPDSTEARHLLGHALFNCNRFSESIDTLAPLAEQGQIDSESLRLLCRAAEESEDFGRAAAFADRLAAASPDQAGDCLILARTRFAAGKEDEGTAAYRRYLAMCGIEPESRRIFPGRVVTTETWEIIASRWISLGLPAENVASGRIRPSLTRHDQALVLAPEWLVITKDNDLLVEQMTHNPKTLRKKTDRIPALTNSRCLFDLPTETTEIVEACALIGGSSNYYHWLIDHLPRIGILAKSTDLRDLHLLVNDNLTAFQRESLAALGIGTERLIELPAGAVAKCRVVWVPTLVSRLTAFHPFVFGWLRRMYLTKEMKQAPRRRLFVSRLDASQRRLLNEAELIERLLPLGFEVISPGALSFIDQVAAFAAAEVIVGPHGAGLTNTIFSPQEVRIFELGFPQYPATFFSNMAGQLGQNFVHIYGQPVPDESPLPHTWDFRVSIDMAMQVITAALT